MRNLLLTVLLGTVVSGNVFAQAEEGDSIPAKYREQQEKYERGEGLYPAKMRNSWKIGGFIGQSAIYGDVTPVSLLNGGLTFSGGGDIEKAVGHLVSLRVLGAYSFARGLNSKLNRGYAGHGVSPANEGKNGYYGNPFASSKLGGESYYDAQTGVSKAVAYNYASKMMDISTQVVFHVGNINYYKEQNKWDLYLGVGPGVMAYQTLVDAKQRVGNDYKLYDFEGAVKGVTPTDGTYFDDLRYDREVRKALQNLLSSDNDDQKNGYNYESDVESDAPIRLEGKKKHIVNVRPMANASLGLRYKVSRRIEVGLEQRMIYAATDLFDGVRWQEKQGNPRGVLSRNNDVWGNTVVNIGLRLGKNSTDALWWVNPINKQAQATADNTKLLKGIADDTDGDGVADLFDKSPDTPNNVTVDGSGKVLDTDMDGVADALDEQPFTAKGCPVDAKGVAKDSDGDGVPDCRDKESGTKAGALVDANGRAIVMPEMPAIPTFDCSKCVPVVKDDKTGTQVVQTTIRECNLPSAHFDNGSSVIKQEFYPDLFYVAKYMLDHGDVSVNVIGQDDKSDAVARKRAESAINFIVGNFGIDRGRFTISTNGGIKVGPGGNMSNKNPKVGPLDYLNRRVDFECK